MRFRVQVIGFLLSLTLVSSQVLAKEPPVTITKSQYVWGGILGILPGFGVGHAIQQRYVQGGGWAFTLGEGVGAAVAIAGGVLMGLAGSDPAKVSQSLLGRRLLLFGGIFYTGFKIWEIVDIWVAPNTMICDRAPSSLLLGERPAYALAPTVGLSLRW